MKANFGGLAPQWSHLLWKEASKGWTAWAPGESLNFSLRPPRELVGERQLASLRPLPDPPDHAGEDTGYAEHVAT